MREFHLIKRTTVDRLNPQTWQELAVLDPQMRYPDRSITEIIASIGVDHDDASF